MAEVIFSLDLEVKVFPPLSIVNISSHKFLQISERVGGHRVAEKGLLKSIFSYPRFHKGPAIMTTRRELVWLSCWEWV